MQLNSADGWLDPSTVKLFMNVKNDSANTCTPVVSGAWGMFSRLRVLCGGQFLDDIDLYGRLHEQFHMMKSTQTRQNDAIEAFGTPPDAMATLAERVVAFTPLSGLLTNNEKY